MRACMCTGKRGYERPCEHFHIALMGKDRSEKFKLERYAAIRKVLFAPYNAMVIIEAKDGDIGMQIYDLELVKPGSP